MKISYRYGVNAKRSRYRGTNAFLLNDPAAAIGSLREGGGVRSATEGERGTLLFSLAIAQLLYQNCAGSFHHFVVPLPLGGRLRSSRATRNGVEGCEADRA